MKKWIAKKLFSFVYNREVKKGWVQRYDYETAPYCGHHYSGHAGKYTCGSFHEGDGEEVAHLRFGKLWISGYRHSDEGWLLQIRWLRRLYWVRGVTVEDWMKACEESAMSVLSNHEILRNEVEVKPPALLLSSMSRQDGWHIYGWGYTIRMQPKHTGWMPDWYRAGKEFVPTAELNRQYKS